MIRTHFTEVCTNVATILKSMPFEMAVINSLSCLYRYARNAILVCVRGSQMSAYI